MWFGIASLLLAVACTAALLRLLFRWIKTRSRQRLASMLTTAGGDDKNWLRFLLAYLGAFCDAVLGSGRSFGSGFKRTAVVSVLLLGIALPVAGLLSSTVLGFSQTPWVAYDDLVRDFAARINEAAARKEAGAEENLRRVAVAQQAHWKYIFTFVVVSTSAAIHWLALWASFLFTRRWIAELTTAVSWLQKAGLFALLSATALLALLVVMIVVVMVSSPASALILIFGSTGNWLFAAGAALVGVLLRWLGDPWYRVVAVTAVLPCISFVALAGGGLLVDMCDSWRTASRQAVLDLARHTLGSAVVPFLIVALVLALTFMVLKAVL